MAITGCVPFTKVPPGGKSCWKVNGTRFFGVFSVENLRGQMGCKKIDPFFRTKCSKRKFVFHFFKAIFVWYQFQAFAVVFSVNETDLYKMVNALPGWNLPVLNFAYHLRKPWTDRFADVNGIQPTLLTAFLIWIVFPSSYVLNYQHVCSFPGFCVLRDDNRSVWYTFCYLYVALHLLNTFINLLQY